MSSIYAIPFRTQFCVVIVYDYLLHACYLTYVLTGVSCVEFQQFWTTGGPFGASSISRVIRLYREGRELHPSSISLNCGVFQALWMPGSQTEIAVVADSFVKVSVHV